MLDVRRMQVLRAVVTSGSVTAAAAHLGYTPSAVSQQVAALERQAGIPLLERVGRGVRPTAAGRLLADHAAVISRNVAEAETALADLRAGRTGRLAVRYFATAGAALVAPALAGLRREHPDVRVDLRMTDPEDPLLEVEQGRADLALVIAPRTRPREDVELIHLLDDAYDAVLPAGHRLASEETIALVELSDEQWVGSEPAGPCLEPVLEACAAAGFSPDFVVQSEDYPTAQGFVAAGLGIGLMPRMGLGLGPGPGAGAGAGTGAVARHPGVVVRPVRDPRPTRAVYAAVRKVSMGRPAVRALLEALRQGSAPAQDPSA
ncbi:LysR family transcriptional regulator [Streptomyces sp. NBC_00335]|uniref:LysR family transcriptional regulator n=1 Tax=unclassified Streptomyces TaxID=2593676 RepID=UPI002256304C|nr:MULTISPECIES: LysR family transcriptional regulator [unclassified Streptomyces]MCX5405896.1 LysR family transcriptional regulator [Streptomyces sp. NBC_00086]